ncbi:MAG: hypothetical protein IT337_16935, partial [Thermomicrobiales bacterium]|nr:hypothetical protein [Thermomicrobiales bacterium]
FIRIKTDSLVITIYDSRTVHIDSDCDLLWPESVEWKALHLVMRKIGALEHVDSPGTPK